MVNTLQLLSELVPFPNSLRDWLELLYFAHGPLIVVIGLFGLKQIRLLKEDTRIRNDRASKEKALEYCARYAGFADLAMKYMDELTAAHLPRYKGPIGDFSPGSIPPNWNEQLSARAKIRSWIPAINELDTIAGAFVTGVAAERTGFDMIGRSYCVSVGNLYDLIANYRKATTLRHFECVVTLFDIWSKRLTKAELQLARDQIDAKLTVTGSRSITPIGLPPDGA